MGRERQMDGTIASLCEGLSLHIHRVRETLSRPGNGGWFRPAGIHLLQVVSGRFQFRHPWSDRQHIDAGEAFIIMPTTRYFVQVEGETPQCIRYAHMDISIDDSLHLGDVADMPVVLTGPTAQVMGDAIAHAERQRMAAKATSLASMAKVFASEWQLALCVLEQAQLHPDGQRMLEGVVRMRPVIRYMQAHLSTEVTRVQLADVAGLSPSRFSAVFSTSVGESPMRFLLRLRLHAVRRQLATSTDSIQQLAERFCFSDGFHLSKAFKRLFGVSPHFFRQDLASVR